MSCFNFISTKSIKAIAPLKKADDAIELITDDLTIDEVIDKIIKLYEQAKN